MKPARSHATPLAKRLTGLVPDSAVNWDAIGVLGSFVCLVHCLVLPLAVVILPWLVLFEGEGLHRGLAVALAVPAVLAFIPGWRNHGKWLPGLFMAGGLIALNAAAFVVPEHWETGLTVVGGLFLIAAHVLNRHLCRRCPGCVEKDRQS